MKIKNIFKKTYQSIYKKLYQYRLYKNKNIHKNFQNMNINISIVMTCFNKVEYTINGIDSVFRNTQDKNNFKYKYYLLDDCSTDSTFEKFHNRKKLIYHCEKQQKGVNNLWNVAFELTKEADFVILVNNDVKFSKNWSEKLINEMIKYKSVAAGPVTNAPGNRPQQDVTTYLNNYIANDKNDNINSTEKKLEKIKSFNYRTINGFCMAFNIKWLNMLNKPIINSSDPNFAGEELLFKKYPCNPLIVPSSFVFHYKQVTVSRKNFENQHFRKNENSSL